MLEATHSSGSLSQDLRLLLPSFLCRVFWGVGEGPCYRVVGGVCRLPPWEQVLRLEGKLIPDLVPILVSVLGTPGPCSRRPFKEGKLERRLKGGIINNNNINNNNNGHEGGVLTTCQVLYERDVRVTPVWRIQLTGTAAQTPQFRMVCPKGFGQSIKKASVPQSKNGAWL